MTFFIHFLLAHFIADYPLQSGKLVQLKMKRSVGVFIHGLIHLGVMLIILSPLLHLKKTWIAVAIVYITHNLIDHTKVRLDKKNPKYHRFLYFLDQTLHWSIIAGVTYYISDFSPKLSGLWLELYTNQMLILYLLLMVVTTYFYDVSRYFIGSKIDQGPYKRDYKTMVMNAVIVTVAFGVYWLITL